MARIPSVAAILAVLVIAHDAGAATLVVPDQFATVQAAIDAASSDDVIMIRPGTYQETLTLAGKNLTLEADTGLPRPVLDAAGGGRVLDVGTGSSWSVLRGLELTGGVADGGGAIRIQTNAGLRIEDCRIHDNRAESASGTTRGGAIEVQGRGTVWIQDSVLEQNRALGSGLGGALFLDAEAGGTVVRSRFEGNEAASGGGLYSEAILHVQESTFVANTAGTGAGIACTLGSFIVEENVFFQNHSTASFGGALYVVNGEEYTQFEGTLLRNTVAFNTSDTGTGGIVISLARTGALSNVVAYNDGLGIRCFGSVIPGAIACNDLWNNGSDFGGTCSGLAGLDDNFAADPLFCDPGGGDLRVDQGSPVLALGSSCGPVGALGAGCNAVAAPPARTVFLAPFRPNPTSVPTSVEFTVPAAREVRVRVYDARGRLIETIAQGTYPAGVHRVRWQGVTRLPAGVYFVRLQAEGEEHSRRLLWLDR